MTKPRVKIILGNKGKFLGALYNGSSAVITANVTLEELERFIGDVTAGVKWSTPKDFFKHRVDVVKELLLGGATIRPVVRKIIKKVEEDIDTQVEKRRTHPTDSIGYAWYDVSIEDLVWYRDQLKLSLHIDRVKDTKGGVTAEQIQRAREYPITNLLPIKNSFTKCIYHQEKTPSMKYYPKTNTVYCFGCGATADSIHVYRFLHNADFVTAVKQLSQ